MWALMATFFTSPALFILLNIVIVIIVSISRLSSSHTNSSDHNNNNNDSNHVTPLARALDRVKSNIDLSFANFNFTPSIHTQPEFHNHPQIVPAPSLIQRLKSVNFSFQNFSDHCQPGEDAVSVEAHPGEQDHQRPQPAELPRAPSILERVRSIDFTSFYNRLDSGRVNPASSSEAEQPQSRGSDPVQLTTSKSEPDRGKVTQRKVNKGKMKKSASELFRRDDHEGEEELERRRPETVKAEKKSETGDVDAKADDFINRFKQQLKLQRLDSLLRYKEMLNPK